MAKTNTTTAKPDDKKPGADKAPTTAAGGSHLVTEGNRITVRGEIREAGYKLSAADLKTDADPTGAKGLKRLEASGTIAPVKGYKAPAEPEGDEKPLDGPGASAAQIQAAEGGDAGAQGLVDALATGDADKVEEASTPDQAD